MARHIELLLLKNIEHLGIVGDVVRVKRGYARNYLLPHGYAEVPTPSRIEMLEEDRAKALSELAHVRSAREELLDRMVDVTLTLTRSCNDQGVLYGSVTQRDICDALEANNLDVGARSVRLAAAIRRVGSYPVPIQFDKDLRTEITVVVEPDQPLEEREEMEFDNEGNLITKDPAPAAAEGETQTEGEEPTADAESATAEAAPAES
ncbi:MAG: 50S ribosomal protein L9 [Phycisphaerae bacterium]|jgi:large subunit ribosomal protein L9|nr:50S ribosomal protein L9 [Phycisphaerae bacterium]|tara:strand:+ start:139 stop:756 length:618 start_codon:yes stop_codon:yes gene_type:complete